MGFDPVDPPNDLADTIAEHSRDPLKFLGLVLLTGLVLWATPYLLYFGTFGLIDMHTAAKIAYIESGKIIGQTQVALDKRYDDFDPINASTLAKSYLVAVVDIDHAYYLHVTFDKSGKAVHALLESADEVDPWTKDVSTPNP